MISQGQYSTPRAKGFLLHVAENMLTPFREALPEEYRNTISDLIDTQFSLWRFAFPIEMSVFRDNPFCRYAFPIEYQWPTRVREKGFIEKAAVGIVKKFEGRNYANIQIFSSSENLKQQARNLRGRVLQVASLKEPQFETWKHEPEAVPPHLPQLIVMLGSKQVVAGICSAFDALNFFAGGRHFLATDVSRAAAKLIEAESMCALHSIHFENFHVWLEFGAAPGGMTQVLLEKNKNVIAVDRAALNPTVASHKNIDFHQVDARSFRVPRSIDAILCDMNGDAIASAQLIAAACSKLREKGLVIFTIKLEDISTHLETVSRVVEIFRNKELRVIELRHLYHNRQELTLIAEKQ